MIVRVVLDTCAVRTHVQGGSPTLDLTLIERTKDVARLSLAASAVVELSEQLIDGRLPFSDWKNRVSALDQVLDRRWPCLPDGRELAVLAGHLTDSNVDVEATRLRLMAAWTLLKHAETVSDLERGANFRTRDGKVFGLCLSTTNLSTAASGRRRFWIDYIENIKAVLAKHGVTDLTEDQLLSLIKSNDELYPDAPHDIHSRLDAVSRLIVKFVHQSLSKKSPYNPSGEKRRGDVFDIWLLFYVPLPAVICTADKRFVNTLSQTQAQHSQQVVTIDGLNQHLLQGTLSRLVAPFRTPDEQLLRWQKAAFDRWQRRGEPIGDDWADWFAVEPVA